MCVGGGIGGVGLDCLLVCMCVCVSVMGWGVLFRLSPCVCPCHVGEIGLDCLLCVCVCVVLGGVFIQTVS